MVAAVAGGGGQSRDAPVPRAALSTVREDQEKDLSLQSSVASENLLRPGSSSVLTLSLSDRDEDDTYNEETGGASEIGKSLGIPAEKGGDRGEATLLKRTHHIKCATLNPLFTSSVLVWMKAFSKNGCQKEFFPHVQSDNVTFYIKLRQFMPSIIEETEDLCKQEEEDEEDEAASRVLVDIDEHDTLFSPEFLKFIIETNVVAGDASQVDPDFAQDFGDVLRMLRKKAKLEEAFAKDIADHLMGMRIKERTILIKYIRHILLHDVASIEEFFKVEGYASVVNVAFSNDETLDQIPGIILATRGQEAALREMVDDGVIQLLAKLSKKTEEAIVAAAAVAQACLIEVEGVDRQASDAWFESLCELGSSKNATAQTYACATLCKVMAQTGRQAKLLQRAGSRPFFEVFTNQHTPEALLWVSSALANLANNSANFQEFLELEALDVLHSMANSTWDEVRLAAAWILVFLSIHKPLHQQAVGHWGAWVREALTIGLCSNDSLTTAATRIFFANITQKEPFEGYDSPIVRSYLKTLHRSDDLVREHAQAFLFSAARQHPTELIESLLALCCTEDAEHSIALKALACLVLAKEFNVDTTKYNVLRPFIAAADRADASTQLLCAQVLTSFVSTQQALEAHQGQEPVGALLFLCDSRHDEVRTTALNGLWLALEVGLKDLELCALPILRCCKEDEPAKSLRVCYGRFITETRKEFTDEWCERASETTCFGVYALCTLVHDASAPVQGRLAYEIEKFSEDHQRLNSLDEIGTRMLISALMSLGKSVVDAVKCSVITVFTRQLSCKRLQRDRQPAGHNLQNAYAASTPVNSPLGESVQDFLAVNYTQCICDVLLDPSAGFELQQHCLRTLGESLDDPLVCRCLGTANFTSRLFSPENRRPSIDPLSYYNVYCRILTHPAAVGHVSDYLDTFQRLLLDAKDFPSLVLPLAQLLHVSSFLPPVQGQQFNTLQASLPRCVLLNLIDLLKRFSLAALSPHTEKSRHVHVEEIQAPLRQTNSVDDSRLVSTDKTEAENVRAKEATAGGEHFTHGVTHSGELLKSTVNALLALYRLGLIKDNLDREIIEVHLLPVFQDMRHSNSAMVSLLSFANSLCEDPVFLDCLLSTSIVSDIASGLAEDSLQDEELCVQVAEFLRMAVLHEGAQKKIIADVAFVDCIFHLIRSSHPAAQVRALSALHSIITYAPILRSLVAENFVQTLCNVAVGGGTADVQRVAAGVISTLIARPSCREALLSATSFMEIMDYVRTADAPEVYLQIVWALSNLPLEKDIVQVITDMRVPEKFKELLNCQPPRIQIQALKAIVQLTADAMLRQRFIKLEFLPLLVNVAKSDDPACCAESFKALLPLSDSAAESATVLDLGLEFTIQEILKRCLQQKPDRTMSQRQLNPGGPPPQPNREDSSTIPDTAQFTGSRTIDWDEARKASLALLCQLCKHAVHDQLALLKNETVQTIVQCTAHTLPQDIAERRSVATLFRLWAAVGRLRKLMIQEGGLDVVIRLVIQAYDAVEMVELSSCIGSFASEKHTALETRLAESGAIDALDMYTISRHLSVREGAQRALSTVTRETMEYSRHLATRETSALGLSAMDQESRALVKKRWRRALAGRVQMTSEQYSVAL